MIWNISLELSDPLLAITKKLLPGGASPLAGKCDEPTGRLVDAR
jgi:hypothetical protein